MKRIPWFIAGLVSGVAVTLSWGGRKKYPPIDVEPLREWHKKVLEESFQESADADLPRYYFGDIDFVDCRDSLADTQKVYAYDPNKPSNYWKSSDGWAFNENGFSMKILGVYDRVLTNDELKRIHGMSADEIEDSFAITQEIKVKTPNQKGEK